MQNQAPKPSQILRIYHKAKNYYRDFRFYDLASQALNRLTPKTTYHIQHNIAYGSKARQHLDLYTARKPLKQQPLIVFVHGGAWQHGDKQDYLFLGETFAREGYNVAVINYQLAPEHIFPSFIEDVATALNFLHAQQNMLGIKTEQIVLMGHSAGAFNIMSLLYHPTADLQFPEAQIRAVINIAGPFHFDYKGDPLAQDAFDQHVPYQQVMPYYFVKQNTIAHYFILAENDHIVAASNSLDLDRMLKQQGNHSQVVTVAKIGHIAIIATLASRFSRFFKTKRHILSFLQDSLER